MQNFPTLFYPKYDSQPFIPEQVMHNGQILNSPSSSSNCDINQEDYSAFLNHRSYSIRVNSGSENIIEPHQFLCFDQNQQINIDAQTSIKSYKNNFFADDILFHSRSQSPEETNMVRGRSFQLQNRGNSQKKSILVIKKESINRQNSYSRSPESHDPRHNMIDQSLGSPYFSPSTINRQGISDDQQKLARNLSQCNETQMKNSVIVRKTVGELKRAQLNIFYFDQNLIKSASHFSNGTRNCKEQTQQQLSNGYQSFDFQGRKSAVQNYQNLIQIKDENVNPFSKTIEKDTIIDSKKQFNIQDALNYNHNQKKTRHDKMNDSSGSDDVDFERQSSNALSVENFNYNSNRSKKVVTLSKNKVNFLCTEQSKIKTQRNSTIVKVSQKSKPHLRKGNTLDELLEVSTKIMACSQSPDLLRRQRSDNLLSHKKSSLVHERSQNHLQIHSQNNQCKLEVPKVVKAIHNNTIYSELLQSPTTAYSSMKESQGKYPFKVPQPDKQKNIEEQKKISKSRQSNIFQMRRSQTHLRGQAMLSAADLDSKKRVIQNLNQKRQNLVNQVKSQKRTQLILTEDNQFSERANNYTRVSQSLLLDNYLSKSKERKQNNDTSINDINNLVEISTKSSEFFNSGPSSTKLSPEIFHTIKNNSAQRQKEQNEFTVPNFLGQPVAISLNHNIKHIDDRQNSPVRVSQYLVDVDYLKAKAQELIKPVATTLEKQVGIEVYQNSKHMKTMTQSQQSNSNNAIMNLSSANTTEKFKEIIDNLFVPTASAFKKKSKEREFRRPTQNVVRKSKQRGQSQQESHIKQRQLEDKLTDYIKRR